MKDFDWSKARRNKDALRERNELESFARKLGQLDRMRERSQAVKAGRVRRSASARGRPVSVSARRKK